MKTLLILILISGLLSCNKNLQVTNVAQSAALSDTSNFMDFGDPYGIGDRKIIWLGAEEFKGGHCLCYIDSSKVIQYIIKGDFPVQPSERFHLDSNGSLIKGKK